MREGIARNAFEPEQGKALPLPLRPKLELVSQPPPPPEPSSLLAGVLSTLGDAAMCWPRLPSRDQGDEG